MPDTLPCPACGTENPADVPHCLVCDYELRVQLPGPSRGGRKCSRCGSHIAGAGTFCQVCGQSQDQRLPRPSTGSLSVHTLFGDQSDAPRRMPIRERTELAPAAARPQLQPFVPPQPVRPEAPPPDEPDNPVPRGRRRPAPRPRPVYSGFDAGDSSGGGQPAPAAAAAVAAAAAAPYTQKKSQQPPQQGTRKAAPPKPRPGGYPNLDPSASADNAPRPRFHAEAHAEPIAPEDAALVSGSVGTYDSGSVSLPQGYEPGPDFGSLPQQPPSSPQPPQSSPQSPPQSPPHQAYAQGYSNYGGAPVQSWGPSGAVAQSTGTGLRVVLVGRDGQEGESFPVPSHGVEIGRNSSIAFPGDPFVSPRHAQLTPLEGGGVHLVDLGSRNGVYLRLTEPAAVYPGDHFLLGNQLLRLDRLDGAWQESSLDSHQVRGFGTPVKPPWAILVRICVGEIDDDRYHLRGKEMIIGREEGQIVFPSDSFLSRAHARLRMAVQDNNMTVLLEDLDSANGTYLRIRGPVSVPVGGMFRVGDQIFRLRQDP
ncbi:FHA domain-containing protein [Pseudenhygromyxa sp. WMMC2535]|uniref:FHA domain-containing protein n=1 Tax=Pseudenhygromyxa sp. WMMC2535 TaxID=2712867 RepID=UPI0015962E3D|nr:FHA domain-containing protein [Pseudenhygromyxa sp. WMMC2535]NVB41537.1 FHA domain-containing protein [Pseudenhygromyxa sp. WMMC2535]